MAAKKPAKKAASKKAANTMNPAKSGKKPTPRKDQSSTKKAPGSRAIPYQGPAPQPGGGVSKNIGY